MCIRDRYNGKSTRALGRDLRERGHRQPAVQALMAAYDELEAADIPTRQTAALTGVSRVEPVNKLSDAERAHVLEVLNSPRFVDQAPLQIYAQLLDEGVYLCSVSTIYRVLRENTQVRDRRRQATHPPRAVPELVATAPRQVYSWDITKLAGPVRGQYFDCYVMIDIYSRYIVGAHVHNAESGPLAVEMMTEVFNVHGVPH